MPSPVTTGASALPLNVVVAGGSIGGLCVGVALRSIGCDVTIYERSPGPMTDRGAGIVVQPDLINLLQQQGAPTLPVTAATQRRHVDHNGKVVSAFHLPQQFTSWNAIYRTLRAAFPDERYHPGRKVEGFQTDGRVYVERLGEVKADLLVFSDGFRSDARRYLLPKIEPRYAGYVAWRGTLDESNLPDDLIAYFDDSFSFCSVPAGGHILCYFIPGIGVAPGQRRLNWVWYVTVDRKALTELLTDRDGRKQPYALAPGQVPDDQKQALFEQAEKHLPFPFTQIVQATHQPFIQAILDLAIPQMVFGRACLLGDAAFVVRPHTAAATVKAAADASALADALRTSGTALDDALKRWEQQQLAVGQHLVQRGIGLGQRL